MVYLKIPSQIISLGEKNFNYLREMTIGLDNVQNQFSGKLETRNFPWVWYDWAYHLPYNDKHAISFGPMGNLALQ